MKDFFNFKHPFYRSIWVRLAILAVCLAWAVVEFTTGSVFWGVLFLVGFAYCGYQFFFVTEDEEE